ncbi:MAG: dCTP deaminase [Spirochaetia bacterium]|nr:dCTP deaminase [Spirochaetota bacterium]MCX8096683.1 dCTP deaminase [Spirochaetota bacterium]MDW8113179.1 dCTP deaminase [Spirochaetia bacterium]
MLTSSRIIEEIKNGNIVIDPFDEKYLNPNSYNLRLHNELLELTDEKLDMKKKSNYTRITIPEEGFTLLPGKLYLGRTLEYTITKNFVPMIEGRSSIGRLGISIHATAGFGDIGFEGYWTLEISVIKPVVIYPFVEICQIYYCEVSGKIDRTYKGKYSKSNDIVVSKMYEEF